MALAHPPHPFLRTIIGFVFATSFLAPAMARAADPISSAEAALARFGAACDGEIMKAVAPETTKRIHEFRGSPFLMVARKSHVDVVEFIDPKIVDAISHGELYGSHEALAKSTGDIWVLTYGNMTSLTIYLDAASGAVLCVAFIPEG